MTFLVPEYIVNGAAIFIEAPLALVEAELIQWQGGIFRPLGFSLQVDKINGDIRSVTSLLEPFVCPRSTKRLLLSTNTGWTVLFDNGSLGTDAGQAFVLATKLKCRTVRIVAANDTMKSKKSNAAAAYGAVIFEVFNDTVRERPIYCANDGGRWVFGQSGKPFDFECIDSYSRKPISARFTLSLLRDYLAEFKIYAFDSTWYTSSQCHPSVLISRIKI